MEAETLPAVSNPLPPEVVPQGELAALISNGTTMYQHPAVFEYVQRLAKVLASSKLVPDHYKNNIPDAIIAGQMSLRLGIDPFTFMQNVQPVRGKPSVEAKLLIALINDRGGFDHDLRWDKSGEGNKRRWVAWTKKNGERIEGPEVTWAMVEADGWDKNPHWKSKPDLMGEYRAASFFFRTRCPQLMLLGGIPAHTREEILDVTPEPTEDLSARLGLNKK